MRKKNRGSRQRNAEKKEGQEEFPAQSLSQREEKDVTLDSSSNGKEEDQVAKQESYNELLLRESKPSFSGEGNFENHPQKVSELMDVVFEVKKEDPIADTMTLDSLESAKELSGPQVVGARNAAALSIETHKGFEEKQLNPHVELVSAFAKDLKKKTQEEFIEECSLPSEAQLIGGLNAEVVEPEPVHVSAPLHEDEISQKTQFENKEPIEPTQAVHSAVDEQISVVNNFEQQKVPDQSQDSCSPILDTASLTKPDNSFDVASHEVASVQIQSALKPVEQDIQNDVAADTVLLENESKGLVVLKNSNEQIASCVSDAKEELQVSAALVSETKCVEEVKDSLVIPASSQESLKKEEAAIDDPIQSSKTTKGHCCKVEASSSEDLGKGEEARGPGVAIAAGIMTAIAVVGYLLFKQKKKFLA